jgi:hypothetical protein
MARFCSNCGFPLGASAGGRNCAGGGATGDRATFGDTTFGDTTFGAAIFGDAIFGGANNSDGKFTGCESEWLRSEDFAGRRGLSWLLGFACHRRHLLRGSQGEADSYRESTEVWNRSPRNCTVIRFQPSRSFVEAVRIPLGAGSLEPAGTAG